MGKVDVIWDVENVGELKEGEFKDMYKNVDVDYELGMWGQVSMSLEMERVYNRMWIVRKGWTFGMFLFSILYVGGMIIVISEMWMDRLLVFEGVLISMCLSLLFSLYWIYYMRNINVLRKKMKGILGGSICMDVFVFCQGVKNKEKDIDVDMRDETVRARAEGYGDLLGVVNPSFIKGWIGVHYIVPKTFENEVMYDERIRKIIVSVVRNSEERMKEDKVVFLDVNKRQVGEAERDFLID